MNTFVKLTHQRIKSIVTDESGTATVLGLLFFAAAAAVGAAAVDYSNIVAAQTHLQVSADHAAHAALYHREFNDEQSSKLKAIDVAAYGAPNNRFGTTLDVNDIQFGKWDYTNRKFTAESGSRSAVMVTTSRLSSKLNSVESFLFRLVGVTAFDVRTSAVFTTYRPACFREGFVAADIVDVQSNNLYGEGFCIHAQNYVSLNSNNTFESGTVVSMPDSNDLDLPKSGFDTNAGLKEALGQASYQMRTVNRIESIIQSLQDEDPSYLPDYITEDTVTLNQSQLDETDFVQGAVHFLNCNGGGQAFLKDGAHIKQVVFVTNCQVKFGQGTILEESIFATTNTGAKSFNAPSSFQLGRDDDCLVGGGSQMVTMGGMDFAADFKIFGSQLIAKETISFSANAQGIKGASIISGDDISGTSNSNMGFCNGSGMERNFESDYFRLAG
ncbi:pilus assembly protein TadG-related protein [Falsihalocynthiibacter arcticus]|uniref:pilus assembly protein TadG-related protein n=1 Tax=Falsihalocynthiibacter arcticus TaxID=1579316 RepID=UPI003001AB41